MQLETSENSATTASQSSSQGINRVKPLVGPSGPTLPTVYVANSGGTLEGDAGTSAPMEVDVDLSPLSDQTVTVDYNLVDGTAILADDDYQATSGMLTFPPGTGQLSFNVIAVGDRRVEGDEYFTVSLSNAVNATVGGSGNWVINNDDNMPPPLVPDDPGG